MRIDIGFDLCYIFISKYLYYFRAKYALVVLAKYRYRKGKIYVWV